MSFLVFLNLCLNIRSEIRKIRSLYPYLCQGATAFMFPRQVAESPLGLRLPE